MSEIGSSARSIGTLLSLQEIEAMALHIALFGLLETTENGERK